MAKVGNRKLDPFPLLKYSTSPAFIDEIDVINKPAFVVPTSGLRSDSIESNRNLRRNIFFTALLPYSFIDRNNRSDLNRGAAWADTEVSQGESMRLISYVLPPENKREEIINICKKFVNILSEDVIEFHSHARVGKEDEVSSEMGGEDNNHISSDNDGNESATEIEQILLNKFILYYCIIMHYIKWHSLNNIRVLNS